MFIPLKDQNPTSRFPYVTVLFIALNILIFFFQMLSPEGLQYYVFRMGAIPYEITHFTSVQVPGVNRFPFPLTLITAMFLHGGLLHLLGNMLYLWIFGNNIEDYLGSARFTLFYLLSGLGASFAHIIFNPTFFMSGSRIAIAAIDDIVVAKFQKQRLFFAISPRQYPLYCRFQIIVDDPLR